MKRRKTPKLKLYQVRTFVRAKNVPDAVRKAKKSLPTDVFVDQDWREGKNKELESAIGYDDGVYASDDDEELEEIPNEV